MSWTNEAEVKKKKNKLKFVRLSSAYLHTARFCQISGLLTLTCCMIRVTVTMGDVEMDALATISACAMVWAVAACSWLEDRAISAPPLTPPVDELALPNLPAWGERKREGGRREERASGERASAI